MIRIRTVAAWAALLVLGADGSAWAGAWVLSPGRTWVGVAALYQDTRERYFLDGRRIPYFFEGRNRTGALFVDARRGLGRGIEAGVQVPFYSLRFDDLADQRRSTDVGDVKAGLRWKLADRPFAASVGVAVKFPTGDFENDAEILPVGEGQYDVEAVAEVGRSLWPRNAYITVLAGYRARFPNRESGIDPGNEAFWAVEAGHGVTRTLGVKGLIRGLHGGAALSFGLPVPSRRREVVLFQPGATVRVGTSTVEVSVPFTLRGRNYPAGPALSVQVYREF